MIEQVTHHSPRSISHPVVVKKASAPASKTNPTAKTAGTRRTDDMKTAEEHSYREKCKHDLALNEWYRPERVMNR